MSDAETTPIRETLLRQCLAADPAPWYPKEYAQTSGVNRDSLYGPLNDLRVANLVQLTEWIRGKGQGYVITPLGREVLADPVALGQLRDGKPPAAPAQRLSPRRRRLASTSGNSPGRRSIIPANHGSCRSSFWPT